MRLLWATVSQITFGIMLLSTSPIEKARERLLAERAAAPAEKKGDYVEAKPRFPDIVAISLLTGILSFAAVPIVFGPAAVITGVMAVSRGYLSGLLGALLGIVGAVGWVLVLTMLGPAAGP
jgi:hypothetical protein